MIAEVIIRIFISFIIYIDFKKSTKHLYSEMSSSTKNAQKPKKITIAYLQQRTKDLFT